MGSGKQLEFQWVPGSGDDILLDNSSVATLPALMNTTSLTMTVMGITFNTTNNVTLGNAGNGNTTSTITLNGLGDAGNTLISLTNTGNFTIVPRNNSNKDLSLVLGASGTMNVTNAATTLTITATIGQTSGGKGITKTGAGTLVLGGTNSYTGLTTITEGTLREGVTDAISTGGVTVNGATAVFVWVRATPTLWALSRLMAAAALRVLVPQP